MKSYTDIMKKAREGKATSRTWAETDGLTQAFLDEMAVLCPDRTQKYLKDLNNAVCFPPLTETEAQQYVAGMDNKDGSKGGHWSLAQVREWADVQPELKHYDCLDFYVAVNMMRSDFYQPAWNDADYIGLACEFLDDKDAPKNKMRRYMEVMEK